MKASLNNQAELNLAEIYSYLLTDSTTHISHGVVVDLKEQAAAPILVLKSTHDGLILSARGQILNSGDRIEVLVDNKSGLRSPIRGTVVHQIIVHYGGNNEAVSTEVVYSVLVDSQVSAGVSTELSAAAACDPSL